MEILFGTTNSAKLETMRRRLDGMGLEILSLRDFASVPEVQEAGRDPLQNARTKAWTYWRFYHRPVFSCDTGLWIRELPEHLQPGVHVRFWMKSIVMKRCHRIYPAIPSGSRIVRILKQWKDILWIGYP